MPMHFVRIASCRSAAPHFEHGNQFTSNEMHGLLNNAIKLKEQWRSDFHFLLGGRYLLLRTKPRSVSIVGDLTSRDGRSTSVRHE